MHRRVRGSSRSGRWSAECRSRSSSTTAHRKRRRQTIRSSESRCPALIFRTRSAGGSPDRTGTRVSEMSLALKLDNGAPQKAPADYTIVGKPVPRLDIPDKVGGRFTYMQDFKLPGMLHGRVIRPSGIGATLVSYDEASINHIPGIVKVVRIGNFL